MVDYIRSKTYWKFLIGYIFSVSVKFGTCYITGQWGEFRITNATLSFLIHFLVFYSCFSSWNLCIYHFHFFFVKWLNFRYRLWTNQKQVLVFRNCLWNCILGINLLVSIWGQHWHFMGSWYELVLLAMTRFPTLLSISFLNSLFSRWL